jgi:YgiT-type zinc finger domain-containing protein
LVKCPRDKVGYVTGRTDYEFGGMLFRNVEVERCPKCGEEVFTPEQYEKLRQRVESMQPPLRLTRRITSAGKRPALYLPEDLVRATGLKVGDEVDVYVQGKKRIVIEAKS